MALHLPDELGAVGSRAGDGGVDVVDCVLVGGVVNAWLILVRLSD